MRCVWALLGLVLSPFAATGAVCQGGSQLYTATRQQLDVTKVVLAQESAWNKGDLDAYLAFYKQTEDSEAVLNAPVHGIKAIRSAFHTSFPNRDAMGTLEQSGVEVHELGPNFAVALGHYKVTRPAKTAVRPRAPSQKSSRKPRTAGAWSSVKTPRFCPARPGLDTLVLVEAPTAPKAITPPPLIEAHGLTKQYGAVRVVDNVSLTIRRGETLGLVGESGSGKSTVARMILRLTEPTAGEVLYWPPEGENGAPPLDLLRLRPGTLRGLRRRLAMVFQDPYAALDPRMTIKQALTEPFRIHGERPQEGLSARLLALLEEVGLDASALPRYPHAFSGGQRQRINIARALALRPDFLVLDEPVSALDVSVGAQVINLLRDLQARHGLTCLFISHSMPLVRYLCHRVAVLQRGRLVEEGTWQQVCESPQQPYTRQLLAATPELPAA